MPQMPVILTTFAQSPSGTYLAALGEEQKQIQAALQPATDSGAIQFAEQAESRNEDIPQLLAKYPNKVSIFHFGGHADSDSLSAEDGSIFVEGLADQLAIQSQLKLVFLNGCQTQAQVQHFFRQGIPLVLATTCSIADGEASYFAAQFYRAIAERHSIRKAFQLAVGALKAKYDQYRGAELPAYRTVRGVRLREQQWNQVPWQLYVQEGREAILEWQLSYPRGLTRLPSLHLETDCLGRETELETLQTLLHESSKVVLVSGLGGMGKTTLAAGYLQWLRNDYDYIAWINSGDDLMSSFALNEDLAKNLELPFVENEKIDDRFARLMNKLRNQPGRNLLVIDDVGDQVSEIAGQLPSGANWQVLVTSRLPLPNFREMKLGVLQANDALRLFRLYFHEGTDEEVQDLLIEINYHTLTIEVMAKTLNRLNGLLTIPELLVILRERKLDDPRLQELVWTRHAGEERAIFFHLMKAFELAKLSEEEIWLMQQYAVLPAMPIEVKTLADLLQQEPLSLNRQVNGLNDKGWIGKLGKGLGMHRMVQEVVKYQNVPNEVSLKMLLSALKIKMSVSEYGNRITDNYPWLIYAETVAKYFGNGQLLFPSVSPLWNNVGLVYLSLGRYVEAKNYLEIVYYSDLAFYGSDHEVLTITENNLGVIYQNFGRYFDAEKMLQKGLEKSQKYYNLQNPSVIKTQINLANVSRVLGKTEIALSYLDKAYASSINQIGSDSPIVLINLAEIAKNHIQEGNYPQAAIILEAVLLKQIEVLGEEHENVLTTKSILANAYLGLRRFKEVNALLNDSLEAYSKLFNDGHPLILQLQVQLSQLYRAIDKHEEAIKLLHSALESSPKFFGESHLIFSTINSELGVNHLMRGDYISAENYLLKALQFSFKNFGEEHFQTLPHWGQLAFFYLQTGQHSKAIEINSNLLLLQQKILTKSHPNNSIVLSNLALSYLSLGDHNQAILHYEKAIIIDCDMFGLNDQRVIARKHALAEIHQKLGNFDTAISILEELLNQKIQISGIRDLEVAGFQTALALAYKRQQRYKDAEILLKEAIITLRSDSNHDPRLDEFVQKELMEISAIKAQELQKDFLMLGYLAELYRKIQENET
ncbi:MAG: tetratricopeptide repeat protein [Haliscomenobacter sp.]|uniref:tetratricopeptide repeat protein n=1 Tax=Haliscomenobacter sp. TaxID=2717303 RepID=UPI0029AD50AA|nr:tetratricopeptide repeat protein [Haliscomenobacter sp.]MDX2070900.1 tetratricopeptide repeat protein [Haliscomenobacter sp.]